MGSVHRGYECSRKICIANRRMAVTETGINNIQAIGSIDVPSCEMEVQRKDPVGSIVRAHAVDQLKRSACTVSMHSCQVLCN